MKQKDQHNRVDEHAEVQLTPAEDSNLLRWSFYRGGVRCFHQMAPKYS